jgi:phytoene dehydrogenase-like protein
MNSYDAIVIGAGHNGLVTANYLARAGKRVLVLERRAIPGGQAVTESFGEGWSVDSLHAGGMLRPDIVRDLGLNIPAPAPQTFTAHTDAGVLRIGPALTDAASIDAIRAFSAADAARWPEFVAFMNTCAQMLDAAYAVPMPRELPHLDLRREGLPFAKLGLRLRRLGKRDMFRFIRALPMTSLELFEEWFESPALRAALASVAVHGHTLGPMSAGTGYTLMHNWLNRGGLAAPQHAAGTGTIVRALTETLLAARGEIRTGSAVQKVLIERSKAVGVQLASGEEIRADVVFSAADPRHTLLTLAGERELAPEFAWHVRNIKMRGAVAKIHLRTDGRHGIAPGTHAIAAALKHVERAYDASKYHEISAAPYLEVNTHGDAVSVHFQYAPYKLKAGDWSTEGKRLEEIALATLAPVFPDLAASVRGSRVLTPLDLEREYGLTEGDMNHGQLAMDQFFYMRPLPNCSDHHTPIAGLVLCGSGVHGGGGISGVAGRNAARQYLGGRVG